MAEKVFPECFSKLGRDTGTFEESIRIARIQINILRTMMSFEMQIEFEKADLNNDQQWMCQ